MQQKPLSDITVLDLTRVLAGPFCTMVLKDLGAEVIKLERPETGDDARQFGPFKDGKSIYFISLNRGKKSIVLNLKDPQDKAKLLHIIPEVDVLVENFKPGTMSRLGLGYEKMKQINPTLIYASISGFGQTGPDSEKAAYDIIVQARSGIMSITGEPEGSPVRVGVSIGDINAAIFATIGIITALYSREKTGQGQHVDVAMLDSMIAILENAIARCSIDNKPPGPLGTRHPSVTPFEAFRAQDDWVIIAVGNDHIWEQFCKAMNQESLARDPRFISNNMRTENHAELKAIIEKLLADKTAKETLELLEAWGIPCTSINTIDKLFSDLQLNARNMIINISDPEL